MSFHPSRRTATWFQAPLAAAVLLAGCQTTSKPGTASGSGSGSGSGQTSAPTTNPGKDSAFSTAYEDWSRAGYRLDWVGFPFPGAHGKSKVVGFRADRDIVVAQDSLSTVTVMEASTGQVRWSSDLTGPLTKWTGLTREMGDAGRLIVSSESEVFMLTTSTGTLVGRERYERVVNTPPMLVGGMVIAGGSTGVVQAHLLGRNVSAWNFGTGGAIDAALVPVGGFVGVVSQTGEVCFLSSRGDLVGRGRVLGPLDNNPTTDGNLMYIAGRDQSVWAMDTSGSTVWRFRTSNPIKAQPVVHDATVYVDIGALGLTAFDAGTGVVKWHANSIHGDVVAVRNHRLLVWDGAGLSIVDPARGDRLDRLELPGVSRLTPDALEDGSLYAISDKGVFAKFTPR